MPGKQRPPVHYLRANETAWTPPQVISLDTETRWSQGPAGEVHQLRLWAARLDSRRPDSTGWTGHISAWGTTAQQLAKQVSDWAKGQRAVWLFAHNLSFDLIVSRLPLELARLKWAVTDQAAGSDTPWLRLKHGDSVLTLADSWGWLRQPIAAVGAMMHLDKPPLPDNDDSNDYWLARCQADTEILAAAMLEIMNWWDSAGLGRFSLTGSASGWNVMRHRMPAKKVTIMPGADGIASDRAAIYGGRRECYSWGEQEDGPWTEYDFTGAYPTIAAHLPLPSKRQFPFTSLPLDSPLVRGAGMGIIARVRIKTRHPHYPVRMGGRVWYPVGEFWTDLAGPEIAEAHARGDLAEIGPGYAHALGWYLQDWAKWVLNVQSGSDDTAPAVAVPMVKHWGRACIGKFAARGFSKQAYGDATGPGWSYLPVWDIAAQAHGSIVEIAGKRWKCLADSDGDNAYPAVLAYVESYTRARLTRVIERLGRQLVTCCDTDGLTGRNLPGALAQLPAGLTAPLVLREKQTWRQLRVIGPQHLVRDGKRKFSGIPASATERDDGTLEALVWPRLAWQLRESAGQGYRRPAQTYTVGASYASGWADTAGVVLPVQLAAGEGGTNRPVPWARTWHAAAGRRLGPVQAGAVLRVFGTEGER